MNLEDRGQAPRGLSGHRAGPQAGPHPNRPSAPPHTAAIPCCLPAAPPSGRSRKHGRSSFRQAWSCGCMNTFCGDPAEKPHVLPIRPEPRWAKDRHPQARCHHSRGHYCVQATTGHPVTQLMGSTSKPQPDPRKPHQCTARQCDTNCLSRNGTARGQGCVSEGQHNPAHGRPQVPSLLCRYPQESPAVAWFLQHQPHCEEVDESMGP